MDLNLDVICRVCLNEKQDLINIFHTEECIPELLMRCTRIKVMENDGLPRHICKICSINAQGAANFKQLCETSDKTLRNYISNIVLNDTNINEEEKLITKHNQDEMCDKDTLNYNCTICYKKHYTVTDLVNHVLENHLSKDDCVYNCTICERTFSSGFDLKKHQVTHKDFKIDGKINKCSMCNQEFSRHGSLLTHMGYHLEKSTHECKECKCYFINKSHLQRHNAKGHADSISDMSDNDNHMNSDIDECEQLIVKIEPSYEDPMIKCEDALSESIENVFNESNGCKIASDSRNDLANIKTEFVDLNRDADYEESFNDIIENRIQKSKAAKTKKTSKRIKIKDLNEINNIKISDNILVKNEMNDNRKRNYLCSMCGKGFLTQSTMDKHMKTHMKENTKKSTHECPICGKVVNYSNHLRVHMRTHKNKNGESIVPQMDNSKKELILCSMCGKSCTSRSNLAVHMRRHLGVMTCICKICGKGYPRSTDLTLHMRQHTGEKPFVCPTCGKCFARSDKLAIHVRIHTGEKPYSCDICTRAFAQSNDLAAHKKRHKGDVPTLINRKNLPTGNNAINDSGNQTVLASQNKSIEITSPENMHQTIDLKNKSNKNLDENEEMISAHNRVIEIATAAVTNNLLSSNCNNRAINLINPDSLSVRTINDLVKTNFIVPDMFATQRAIDLANHANMLVAHHRNEFSEYTTATLLQNLSNVQSAQFDMR